EELRVEFGRVAGVVFVEPAAQAGTEDDVFEGGFERVGELQAGGAQAGGDVGIAQGGDGELARGQRRGAAPEAGVEEGERFGWGGGGPGGGGRGGRAGGRRAATGGGRAGGGGGPRQGRLWGR